MSRLYRHAENLTDAEKYALNGPVKQVMQTTYKAHLSGTQVTQGKIESRSSEDNYLSTYNAAGTRIADETYSPGYYTKKKFDDYGKLQEETTWFRGELSTKTVHEYNSENLESRALTYDKKGVLTSWNEKTYNEFGQLLENTWYRDGEISTRYTYKYGNHIQELNGKKYRNSIADISYKGDGTIDRETQFKYDDNGRRIEYISRHSNPESKKFDSHVLYKYNQYGDCIEMTYLNPDGSIKSNDTFKHEYDADGKKIVKEVTPYDPYALEPGQTEELTKDHHGNWVKRIVFYKKRPITIYIRRFSYYGEETEHQEDFVHPMTIAQPGEVKDTTYELEEMEPEDAQWLAAGVDNPTKFPIAKYYTLRFRQLPSTVEYTGDQIEALALLELLRDEQSISIVHSEGQHYNSGKELYEQYTLVFNHHPGYMLQATNINEYKGEQYDIPFYITDLLHDDYWVHFGTITLFKPAVDSCNSDTIFEEEIMRLAERCSLRRIPEKPFIHIIETSGSAFVMKEHSVNDSFEIKNLDVHYGYGFQQFHDELMDRFRTSTKGLILFHGEPGTGKTYYIRHLLRSMVANNKAVIYMPPNMADHMTDPAFMTFLTTSIRNFSAARKFCVLLIEDAEPLLAKRREGVRIQGVTNLLNLSDGLLNDMLNLQIICTFNVDLQKLDSALLRPGRLIARKEFKKLDELDANRLAQRLGIKHRFKGPATLGEIYAMRYNSHTLIHDVAADRDAAGIIDDL